MDVKPFGTVYRHITENVEANFGKHTLPWKYNKTVNALLKAAVNEYKTDKNYPIELHEHLSDIVIRWCFDGYPQTDKDDLMEIFKTLWRFHKKWLLNGENHTAGQITAVMNSEATDIINKACSGINQDFEKRKSYIEALYVAVMEHCINMAQPDKPEAEE